MTTKTFALSAVFWAVLLPLADSSLLSQAGRPASTWDGIFGEAQAARGRQLYVVHCASCHGEDLTGGEGKSLVGNQFWQSWGEDSLRSLFSYVAARMPHGAPGSLEPNGYLDLVALILRQNGYPPGTDELRLDRLDEIRVLRKDGPGPVPDFALVTTVGCLAESSPGRWTLSDASNPVRTRNPEASAGSERQRAESVSPGANRFDLMNVPATLTQQRAQRVEVKGLLIRGSPDKLNVTSVQTLTARCAP